MRSLFRRKKPEPRPVVVDVETSFPVMRHEPLSSFTWLDLSTAPGEIARRRASGAIDDGEAALLEYWHENGYVVLERCVDPADIDAIIADVDTAWGERQHVSIDVLTDGRRTFIDDVEASTREVPYKLNDQYVSSDAVRRVFLNDRIVRFAELVFDAGVVGCNSLTFERGTQQPAHIDHVYMTPTPPRRLIASWVALEDISASAGPLVLWPGSHRLPPFDFGEGAYHYSPERDADHTRYVAEQKERFTPREFLARKGDVLLWHSFFVHGGAPIADLGATRRSLAFHYFSTDVLEPAACNVRPFGRAFYLAK
jgi:phytanoyl-CoA hydroxylase